MDCAFWGLPKEVAAGMDTASRTLLELSYEALEDAGFDPYKACAASPPMPTHRTHPHRALSSPDHEPLQVMASEPRPAVGQRDPHHPS